MNLAHLCQLDYDILLEKGCIESQRVNMFSAIDENVTYRIMVDGTSYNTAGKFIGENFHLLNHDGKVVKESTEAFRKHLERLVYDTMTSVDSKHPDFILASRIKNILDEK